MLYNLYALVKASNYNITMFCGNVSLNRLADGGSLGKGAIPLLPGQTTLGDVESFHHNIHMLMYMHVYM